MTTTKRSPAPVSVCLSMVGFFMAVATAPAGTLSCAKDCKSVGCGDFYGPITVDVIVRSDTDASISPTDYTTITVETEAGAWVFTCHKPSTVDPLRCEGSPGAPVSVQPTEEAVGDWMTIFTIDLGTPKTVSIQIGVNGVEVASESFRPNYEALFYPNGLDCGGSCHTVDYPPFLAV